MTHKKKLQGLVSADENNTAQKISERIKNRAMLRESAKIAMLVLLKLKELGWSQRRLAEEMGVSPQFINKIVSGRENLTLETQVKLQTLLDIPILASYYRDKERKQITAQYSVHQMAAYEMLPHTQSMQKNGKSIQLASFAVKLPEYDTYPTAL